MAGNYFIFVANDVQISPEEVASAYDIADALLGRGFWAFTTQAPLRTKLVKGDEVLVYLAGPGRRYFVAAAQVAAESGKVSKEQRDILRGFGLSFMEHSIVLSNIRRLEPFIEIRPLIPNLDFIVNKENYGLHLRLPIVQIKREDFDRIIGKARMVAWK
ncbi:MAG TPA: EVE domain-containing protein [Firmicutes bacterium]|nr:EVE domain-containing protein [Bacillota bacterium]